MNALVGLLLVDLALLALAVAGAVLARDPRANSIVYAGALALSVLGLAFALAHFLGRAAPQTLVLPIGLPWLGAHFRLDALSAFFLALAHLGGAAASLYGLGYGRHEREPGRVLPFYPAFLAGLALVPLADDAYTFLVAWEFMSLSSWALVTAHHRSAENRNAGFVYLVMAVFGALMLLLAFGAAGGGERRLRLRGDARPSAQRRGRRAGAGARPSSAPAPRRGSRPCMSGCRSPIRRRPAMSRR